MERTIGIQPYKGRKLGYKLVRSRDEFYPDGHPDKKGGCVGYTHVIQTNRYTRFYKGTIEKHLASMVGYMAVGECIDLYAEISNIETEQLNTIIRTEDGVFWIEDTEDGVMFRDYKC